MAATLFNSQASKGGNCTLKFVLLVPAGPIPDEKNDGKMLTNWMIAVIAGAGGVFLLAAVILALCCFKRRRNKTNAGKKIPTAHSYSAAYTITYPLYFNWLKSQYTKTVIY